MPITSSTNLFWSIPHHDTAPTQQKHGNFQQPRSSSKQQRRKRTLWSPECAEGSYSALEPCPCQPGGFMHIYRCASRPQYRGEEGTDFVVIITCSRRQLGNQIVKVPTFYCKDERNVNWSVILLFVNIVYLSGRCYMGFVYSANVSQQFTVRIHCKYRT